MRKVASVILCLWFAINAACATSVVIPYTFQPGTTIQSGQVNANFTAIAATVNGNLDSSNLSAGANIKPSQLNLTLPYLNTAASSSTLGFGVGQLGDTIARGGIYGDGSYQLGAGGGSATDIGWTRSGASTMALYIPGGGTPTLNLNGYMLTPAQGGTGISAVPTNGQIPIGNGTNYTAANITSGGGVTVSNGAGTITLGGGVSYTGPGRLSISSTSPYPQNTTGTTLYYLPVSNTKIALYNGTTVIQDDITSSGLSVSVPNSTATAYDVYVSDSSGTPGLHTVQWTNGTTPPTRGYANGIAYTNNNTQDRWVGSIYTDTSSSGQLDDQQGFRGIWNLENQVDETLFAQIAVSSWTYSTTTWRASDANSTYGQGRVGVFIGGTNASAPNVTFTAAMTANYLDQNGIGVDSTTAPTGPVAYNGVTGGPAGTNTVNYAPALGAGFHYLQMLEWGSGSGATWSGNGTNGATCLTGVTRQ